MVPLSGKNMRGMSLKAYMGAQWRKFLAAERMND